MRKTWASALLLVVALAVLAPLANATVLRDAHACCFKHRQQAGFSTPMAQHNCCGHATLTPASAVTRPAVTTRPALAHPFLEEFYPSADSFDTSKDVSQRAPPAPSYR
jgi:hypothetical protein